MVVTAVNASPTAEAGKTTRISWSVSNQGTGDSDASWNDRIIASTNDTLGDGDDIELARFSRNNGVLSSGETDSRTEDVLIPFKLKGEYNLFVQTDTNDDVYEADKENNNDSTDLPLTTINVNRDTPDLEVFDVSAEDGVSGKPLTVSWKVKNIGEGSTNTDYWYDEVFLSKDQSYSLDDTYLGAIRHSGVLGNGDEYPVTSTSDFIVPINVSGDYYVIVRSDSNKSDPRYSNRVLEISEDNNEDSITIPINIALSPVPDLQVTNVDAPQTAISAQELSLSWTVSNFGADSGNVSWTDAVYLSRDKIFDRTNDIYLGGFTHAEGLANGDSYTETQYFTIPRGLTGPFYAFVVTDSRDGIEERGDNFNNDNYDEQATQVILPPPADLVPVAGSLSFNANGIPGQFATINYTVTNQGNDTALGSWSDALYLSSDNQWDINDTLIGLSQHSGDVAVGDEYNGSLNAILPAVVPGDYHVLLHSDIRNQVPETDEENNKVASIGKVTIDFESLNVGGTVTGSLAQGQEVYYKIDAQAGQAIRLQLDSANNNAVNELYIRYGDMPTRGQFDYTAEDPFQADPEFVVPVEQDGTYYVLVYGNSVNSSGYTLSATDIPFSVINVETNTVGNVGEATLRVEGARFDSGTSFELINEQGEVISQTQVRLEDSTTAFVTFDFNEQALGSYSIKATQTSGEIATLADTVTVQEGIGAIINDAINGPQRVWAGQKYPINVSYGNSGDVDTEAPLLIVRNKNSATGTTSRYNNESQEDKVVLLYGLGKDVGADTLRPQESHSIPLYFSHLGTEDEDASVIVETINSDNIEFISFEDWTMLQQSTKPDSISDTDWNVFWSNVQPGIGQTWGDYAGLIAQLSEAYNQPGERIYDVKELFARWYADTDSTLFQFNPRPSISGQLINEETGLPAAEVVLNLYQEELPGRYFYQFTTDEEGKFKVDSLGAGTYKLAIPNGYSFADANQSVGSIDANDAFYTISVAEDSGDIDLTLDINSPPPPPFDPSYLESFKENYPEIQQEMDEIINNLSSQGSQSSNSSGSSGNTSSNLITEPSSNGLPVPAFPGGGGDIIFNTPFGDFTFGSSYSRDEKRKCDGAYAEDSFKITAATPTIIEGAGISFTPAGSLKFRSDYTVDKKSCLYEHEKTTISAGIDYAFTSKNPLLTVLWLGEKFFPGTEVAPVLAFIRDTIDRLQENVPFIEEYLSASVSLSGGFGGKAVINDDGTITGGILSNLSFKGALNIDLTSLDIPFKASISLSGVITQQMVPYPFFPQASLSASVLLQVGRFQFAPSTNPISIGFAPPLPPLKPGKEFGRGLLVPLKRNLSQYTLPDDCECKPEKYSPTLLKSADPNDILGPSGYGSEKWIPATDPLEYTIRFENMPTATAPAKQVVITQKLDSDLDLRSFRLGSLGWGDLVFQVPENRSFYSERIDLTSEYGIYADITAFIDIATGEIKWEIKAIDPETGDIPTDPLKGFLPPNDENRIGEGFVTYTIKSKNDANTGDRIDAEARIIFDNNEPIDTPSIFNTIDAGKPTSEVASLPSVSENTTFLVKWAGNDETDGSGLATYNVYVSEDDGAFELWQGGTTLTEATFEGEAGRTYKFYSLANDNAGNQQDVSTATPVTVEILSRGTFDFSAPSFSINENGTALASITVNRTNGSYGAAEVTLELSDNTATGGTQPYNDGVDYDNSPIVVSFADGETSKVVTVPINDDTELEGHEIINLSLSNPTNGAVVGEQSTAVIKLIDDDTNLKFNLTPEVDLSNQVLAAFAEAANYWTSIISNTADVNITVGFRDLGAGVLAQNTAERSNFTYTDVYNALAANRTSLDDFTSSDNLQDGSQFSLLLNRTSNNPSGSGSITPYLDNDGDANNTTIRVNRANAKGLGLIEADDSSQDALLILNSNSNFTWDFDPSDGISTGAYDFVGLVAHEIGHTLGFDSGVDVLDTNSPTADDAYTYVTPMDLFRFSADSIANGNGVIDWTASTTDKYFSIDGGNTKLASFATGVNYGDGYQASHFKDSEVLSIMNPKLAPGEQLQISSVDKQVFDVIGWNFLDANTDFTQIAFSADEFSVNEDGTAIDSVTIVRTGNTQGSHSVNITVTDNTATSPADYENTSIVVNFADGETTKTVEIPIVDDIAQENDETITLSLSNPTGGATIGTQSTATIIIIDNDTLPPVNLVGTSGKDTLQGGDSNEIIDGLEGNDSLIGGAGNDSLIGGSGKDTLDGGTGTDTLMGGTEDDTYIINSPEDIIIENESEGFDVVEASIDYSMDGLANVEYLILTGNALSGTGNSLDNYVDGNELDNVLNGGEGDDDIWGLKGNDILNGDAGNDTLKGHEGDDTLDGGAGNDTLEGGAGNDTYIIGSTSDTIVEGSGIDMVKASINYSIANLSSIEDLTLIGDAISGTGNSRSNKITGNTLDNILNGGAGNDTLDGGSGDDTLDGGSGNDILNGGAGNDTLEGSDGEDTLNGGAGNNTLIGGTDNDTYIVDSVNNIIVENTSEGFDIVKASVDYSIDGFDNVEHLILTGSAVTGTGNSLDNYVDGNDLDNILNGQEGDDDIWGLKGNDILNGGTGNDTLTGHSGDDTLIGGMGDDELIGSDGDDVFVFNNLNEGIDEITNFSVADDTIHVSAAGFGGGLTAGSTISEDQILIGSSTQANNATQRFIYRANTGALYFDADGNETGFDAVRIATLSNEPTIGASDIFVTM